MPDRTADGPQKNISIIAHLSDGVKKYVESGEAEAMRQVAEGVHLCPICLSPLKYQSSYERGIKETGDKITIIIVRCPKKCDKGQALLPDFISQYKQYSIYEIEKVIIASESTRVSDIETEASEATVRRWIKDVGQRIVAGISVIKAIFIEVGAAVSELRLDAGGGITALEELLDNAPKVVRHSGSTLGLANLWLMARAPPLHI